MQTLFMKLRIYRCLYQVWKHDDLVGMLCFGREPVAEFTWSQERNRVISRIQADTVQDTIKRLVEFSLSLVYLIYLYVMHSSFHKLLN